MTSSRPSAVRSAARVGRLPVTNTPVAVLTLPLPSRNVRLRLTLASANRYGSIKTRTAEALLNALTAQGALRPGGHIVESTSGNLGVALAGLCRERGHRCTLMVDATTPASSLAQMAKLGAELVTVEAADPSQQVHARIDAVHAFRAQHPNAVWTDQYHNPAGPAVHAATTGPDLLRPAVFGHPDAVVIPVSTGGTMAGVIEHLRVYAPGVRNIAVDAVGSAATGGQLAARPRKLPGFGSGLRSALLRIDQCDQILYVGDDDAGHACRIIRARSGLSLGGSAGAAVVAASRMALHDPSVRDIACLCPDGGDRYENTIYAYPTIRSGDDSVFTVLADATFTKDGIQNAP